MVAVPVVFLLAACSPVRESLVVDTNKGFRTREVLCSSRCSKFSINSQSHKGRADSQMCQACCTVLDFRHPVQAVYLLGKREEHLVQAEGHDEAHAIPDPGSS